MDAKTQVPHSLLEAVQFFAQPEVSLAFVARLRWPDGVACPHCQATEPSFLSTRRIWKCRACKKQFSAKVGTIFEDSPIALEKWLPGIWSVVNCRNGISSYDLARALGVTQKTAWFMVHRVRLAVQTETFGKLSGVGRGRRDLHRRPGVVHSQEQAGREDHRRQRHEEDRRHKAAERHGEPGHSTVKAKVVPTSAPRLSLPKSGSSLLARSLRHDKSQG
jgi:transposase-like protein